MTRSDDITIVVQFAEAMAEGQHGPGRRVEAWCEEMGYSSREVGEALRRLGEEVGFDAGWED